MSDLIDRQAAIDALRYAQHRFTVADEAGGMGTVKWSEDVIYFAAAERALTDMPSAQPERDIPIKPKETTDRFWGMPVRQALCPKCDDYLGHDKDKRVSYCETCGQAIDWEGWELDE